MATTYSTQYCNDIGSISYKNETSHLDNYKRYFNLNKDIQSKQTLDNAVYQKTTRYRRVSSLLHHIIVESIYEGMDTDEIDIAKLNKDDISLNNNNNNSNNSKSNIENQNIKNKIHTLEKIDSIEQSGDECTVKDNHLLSQPLVRKSKKVYKNKKHHSDYDIVYLQVDPAVDDDIQGNETTKTTSIPDFEQFDIDVNSDDQSTGDYETFKRPYSKSDSNLSHNLYGSNLSIDISKERIKKSASHVDITSTRMYKEIYADNLRQYGFLMAKQLGINKQSPDQLRKTYQKGRQRALERRERANTTAGPNAEQSKSLPSHARNRSLTNIDDARDRVRKLSSQSNISVSLTELGCNKYTSSLTDITNITNYTSIERHKKPATTTVIRRRKGNKLPRDPTKRLSAPIPDTFRFQDMEDNDNRKSSLPGITLQMDKKPMVSLSVPDLSGSSISGRSTPDSTGSENDNMDNEGQRRKLSDESMLRQQEAKARLEYRMSRIKSFDGILSKANTWIKDNKSKKQECDIKN